MCGSVVRQAKNCLVLDKSLRQPGLKLVDLQTVLVTLVYLELVTGTQHPQIRISGTPSDCMGVNQLFG